eukprot:TRINITY_DN13746_c0_g1_i1.p2 TRINITY_DN13746_c0_g1~~TRINITY_DN13746_c0_g1_i1.p2  ORF type:complete len:107 (-),score=3.29 TRINITY_DN13746_c0_g1_i1:345-665(-)
MTLCCEWEINEQEGGGGRKRSGFRKTRRMAAGSASALALALALALSLSSSFVALVPSVCLEGRGHGHNYTRIALARVPSFVVLAGPNRFPLKDQPPVQVIGTRGPF